MYQKQSDSKVSEVKYQLTEKVFFRHNKHAVL